MLNFCREEQVGSGETGREGQVFERLGRRERQPTAALPQEERLQWRL